MQQNIVQEFKDLAVVTDPTQYNNSLYFNTNYLKASSITQQTITNNHKSLNNHTQNKYYLQINKSKSFFNKENQNLNYVVNLSKKNLKTLETEHLHEYQINVIQVLNLSDNRIQDIPFILTSMQNLKILKLDNNLIKTFPENILCLLKLEKLSVCNNLLIKIPENLETQTELEYIDFSKNHIYILNDNLFSLSKVKTIKINANCFVNISFKIIKLQDTLQKLYLDWIEFIDDQIENVIQGEALFEQEIVDKSSFDMYDLLAKQDFVDLILCLPNDKNKISQEQYSKDSQRIIIKDEDLEESDSRFQSKRSLPKSNQQFNCTTTQQRSLSVLLQPVIKSTHNKITNQSFDPNFIDSDGRTWAHKAVSNENVGALRQLIERYPLLMDTLDNYNHTPLSLAIKEERYLAAKYLIQNNADINKGGGNQGSVLCIAILKVQFILIKDLITRGAKLDIVDEKGNSPFHYVFQVFHKDEEDCRLIANLLLNTNCNPNLFNDQGYTPLLQAGKKGSIKVLNYCFEKNNLILSKNRLKYPFNFQKQTIDQQSLLHVCLANNRVECVLFLLKNNINQISNDGNNSTCYDLVKGDLTLQKLIAIHEKHNINKHFQIQKSPKHIILENNDIELSQNSAWRSIDNDDQPTINPSNFLLIKTTIPKFKDNLLQDLLKIENYYTKSSYTDVDQEVDDSVHLPYSNFRAANHIALIEEKNNICFNPSILTKSSQIDSQGRLLNSIKKICNSLKNLLDLQSSQVGGSKDLEENIRESFGKYLSSKQLIHSWIELQGIIQNNKDIRFLWENMFKNQFNDQKKGIELEQEIKTVLNQVSSQIQKSLQHRQMLDLEIFKENHKLQEFITCIMMQFLVQFLIKDINRLKNLGQKDMKKFLNEVKLDFRGLLYQNSMVDFELFSMSF